MEWFAVRSIVHHVGLSVYEERITLWQALSLGAAIQEAEEEAIGYAEDVGAVSTSFLQGYGPLERAPGNSTEVFSLMRESTLLPEDYISVFFGTGREREEDFES
jgi:hypothetical protein